MQPTAEDTIITAGGEKINYVALVITRNGIEPYVPKSSIQAQEILTLCDRNPQFLTDYKQITFRSATIGT